MKSNDFPLALQARRRRHARGGAGRRPGDRRPQLVAAAAPKAGCPIPLRSPIPSPPRQPRTGEGECAYGQVADPNSGDCVPAMGGLASEGGAQPIEEPAPRLTQDITETSSTGVGANLVPNINGDPCTGYWQSVACSEMEQDNVPVHPRTTLSSSP
ncbi:MAG: hypothetical protein U0R81_12495 [Mycobacterium sp.]